MLLHIPYSNQNKEIQISCLEILKTHSIETGMGILEEKIHNTLPHRRTRKKNR